MFALDTNTLIYFFKGIGRVGEHLRNTPPREISVPSVVLYELEVGVALSPQRENRGGLSILCSNSQCSRIRPSSRVEDSRLVLGTAPVVNRPYNPRNFSSFSTSRSAESRNFLAAAGSCARSAEFAPSIR